MMKLLFLPLTALCIALTGCQTTSPKAPDRFARVDVNHDNKLSLDEVNNYLVFTTFDSRDANHDGKMTMQEWVLDGDKGQEKLFVERDANHDGVVTVEEALAYGKRKGMAATVMKKADTNKDGFLSREEVTVYYASTEGPAR